MPQNPAMRHVKRSALVGETPERMFELINDVERYPDFVPWCTRSSVVSRTDGEVVARLDVKRGPLQSHFTTKNRLQPPDRLTMELVDGPFRRLDGLWTITPIRAPDGSDLGCRVELAMSFEFANALTGALLEPVFEHTAASLVDAFVGRARSLRAGGTGVV
jgi:ribosome-associated toxin RatA of RatAB toxin-antitoxin module